MNKKIPLETKNKLIGKLYGIYLLRSINEKPKITVPEFKFMIGVLKIKKKQWFYIAKELEKDGIIKLHGNRNIEIQKEFIKKIKSSLTL